MHKRVTIEETYGDKHILVFLQQVNNEHGLRSYSGTHNIAREAHVIRGGLLILYACIVHTAGAK